jgi:tryptophan synthase beta chain
MAIREAKQAKEEGKARTIVLNWSGHGIMDLSGYQAYMEGRLHDYVLPDSEIKKAQACLEGLPMPPPLK